MSSPNPKTTKALQYVVSIISICLALQIIISFPLWQGTRSFPKLPVIDFSVLETPLLIALALGLSGILLFQKRVKWGFWLALLALSGLILSDLNRLQVWVYFQASILGVLGFRSIPDEVKKYALQWMVAALYIWGGIHKLNIYFVEDIFPWLLEPLIGEASYPILKPLAICAALFELLIGCLFLLGRYRKIAFHLALVFHITLLLLLGPTGHNWNEVVWPWNAAMIFLNYFLFYQSEMIPLSERFSKFRQFPIFAVALLIFGLMPAFNRLGYWDEQLSFKMYSGTQPEGIFYFTQMHSNCNIPTHSYKDGLYRIELNEWASSNLKIPLYASQRTLMQLGLECCKCSLYGQLEIITAGTWSKEDQQHLKITCKELRTLKYGSIIIY